jgi:hypothetical protein
MPNLTAAILLIAAQQQMEASGFSQPTRSERDTSGYWQQRVAYTITATLDERAQRVRANATMRYVNNSPDTLREMYVHQYLNAFRPGSKWSEVDEREGRVRFQRLEEPDYGYERFTAPVRVNGVAVTVQYPGAPDSTVARFSLPAPLAPKDSVVVAFEWDARPSTVPRRQGRRGRHWDLAQWYPKVAVFDRGGWQPNALQPAGEFYGEFATYDVTLLLANDQVVAATGVPVSGDPGWARVIRAGSARLAADAYDSVPPPPITDAQDYRAVRFFARDVHHFGWSASPDYRYEGGVYARRVPRTHFKTWDTVSVHVLWRAGDDTTWGGLRAVRRTIAALQWLEELYGPYAYPQLTANHRLDGGGTEMPMIMMNGSPSQGLILHEGGHMYSYGLLANNEWRDGWMDEGLTSYQTAWAQLLTPQERFSAGIVDQVRRPPGYRGRAIQMALPRFERVALDQSTLDLLGGAEPMGKVAHEFRDFATYQDMIYDRAEVMYGQLRDLIGDSLFVAFLHEYYDQWTLKHVDERAMRAAVERVTGRNPVWFFDQWVHRTGVMDYRLGRVRWSATAGGSWVTEATVHRRGEYRHAVPVGVRTRSGWTLGRLAPEPYDGGTIRITTTEEPLEVRLDPLHFTWDWDRRNDVRRSRPRWGVDWPFLTQADRERTVALLRPMAWYSATGGATIGLRQRSSYLGLIDQLEAGVAVATSNPLALDQRIQSWARIENPYLPGLRRPAIGWRASAARLDAIDKYDLGWRREITSARRSRVTEIALTYARPVDSPLAPELWSRRSIADLSARWRWQFGDPRREYWFVEPRALQGKEDRAGAYTKLEVAAGMVRTFSEATRIAARVYGGLANGPPQRALFVSAADPVSTFENHWWRPAGAILKRPNVNWLPLGGAALRGFHWDIAAREIGGGNVDAARLVAERVGGAEGLELWMHAFADAAHARPHGLLADAGVGLSVRGALFDLPIVIRVDAPVYVNEPRLAIDRGRAGSGAIAPRWAISFTDLW